MQHATALAFSQLSQSVYADQLGKKNRKKRGEKKKKKTTARRDDSSRSTVRLWLPL